VALYLRRFQEWSGVGLPVLRERAASYARVIEGKDPAYAAIMGGIAEGSGQDLLDIVAINVRYELLYSEFARVGMEGRASPSIPGGCTSFAIEPEASANGHTLLGQNWDWLPEVQGVLQRAPTDGVWHLGFTEAGIAGAKIGLNEAKLGLAVNGLVSNEDRWSRLAPPFHARCRRILGSRSVREAKAAVLNESRSCSANFLIAQGGKDGEVVDVEAAPERACELGPRDGVLAHTNHFVDPERLGIWQPLAGDRPSTQHRYDRASKRLASLRARGAISIEDLQGLLRDHEGGDLSICRHANERMPPRDRFATVVSVVMDLDDRSLFLAAGPPCTAPFQRFELTA
jgi:isopenicillin-N N-acyltransferase-like protein